jgi:hypothetical protein
MSASTPKSFCALKIYKHHAIVAEAKDKTAGLPSWALKSMFSFHEYKAPRCREMLSGELDRVANILGRPELKVKATLGTVISETPLERSLPAPVSPSY